jgi:threonyl-tRNA synthetase
VLNITQNQAAYAEKVAEELKTKGIRALTDLRNEKIGFKIREHTVQRVPYLVVIGDREVEQQTVTIRTREGKDLGSMTLNEFEDKLISECKTKAVNS